MRTLRAFFPHSNVGGGARPEPSVGRACAGAPGLRTCPPPAEAPGSRRCSVGLVVAAAPCHWSLPGKLGPSWTTQDVCLGKQSCQMQHAASSQPPSSGRGPLLPAAAPHGSQSGLGLRPGPGWSLRPRRLRETRCVLTKPHPCFFTLFFNFTNVFRISKRKPYLAFS